MDMELIEVAITTEKPKYLLTNQDTSFGSFIDPIKRMDIFSPDEFERFIELWATEILQSKYEKIVRCGGAGDMGRDVIAYLKDTESVIENEKNWDNYQCKHYKSPLMPSNIWVEIGKLCYYTFKNKYSIPKHYYFVCQKGIGNSLNILLENPDKLKKDFISNWTSHCEDKITANTSILLTEDLLEHINNIDFNIFSHKTPLELIKSFEGTMSFASIFGGGLKKRREVALAPPSNIQSFEFKYTEKLFEAYEDYLKNDFDKENLENYPRLKRHFDRQRLYYYAAETLLDLERDTRPKNDEFISSIKDEVFNNIIDTLDSDYDNGFERVKAVTDRARLIALNSHPLTGIVSADDTHGVCHHLANEDRIDWVGEQL